MGHTGFPQREGRRIQIQHPWQLVHRQISVGDAAGVAACHPLSGLAHPAGHRAAVFRWCRLAGVSGAHEAGEGAGFGAAHHHLQVEPIQQRAREPGPVAPPQTLATAAVAVGFGGPAAGAGIGGGHQGDAAGEAAGVTRPAQAHLPLLQGLAQLVEHLAAELRQFIEKQHPPVGQAQLAGPRR